MVSFTKVFLALTLIILSIHKSECGIYSLIRDVLQWNVAGIPEFHQTTHWDFDPDVSQKRREQFYELHGYRAAKYLDRIGEGIDGRHRERQYENAARDEGRLQGLNLLRP